MHSFELGPLQVAHAGSHGWQTASLVAVQTSFSNCPGGQVVQVVQVVCPVAAAKVPLVQPGHVVDPDTGCAVPAAQLAHVD